MTALLMTAHSGSAQQCTEEDHHPENGGYFIVGAAGVSDTTNLDSAHGQKLPDFRWDNSVPYPHGQFVICDPSKGRCSDECTKAPGCQQFMSSHTCSILRFCNNETEHTVHRMKDYKASEACDFTDAELVGRTLAESDTGCVDYVFEEDHELTEYYFASEAGCAQGQKLAVKIADFTMTADQCTQIGLTTPRIRDCDCRLQKKPSTLGEPCRTAFSDSCQSVVQEGDCCESGTCISTLEDFSHPDGKAKEQARRDECEDEKPGLCYNEDGKGTDTNRMGSTNCCTQTCKSCGTEDSAFAQWKPCADVDASNMTASCGFLSRYDSEPFVCDFSKCASGDHWSSDGEAMKALLAQDPSSSDDNDTSSASAAPVALLLLAVSSFGLISSA